MRRTIVGMKRIAATWVLTLTACAAGQSVVLAPPDQQERHTEHVGTFTAIYEPPIKHAAKPTVVLGSGSNEQNCYVTYDFEDVPHSYCEDAAQSGRTDVRMYLRNFHGTNGEFTALLEQGSKCDPLRIAREKAIHNAVFNENKQITATFDFQEKGRNDITVACTYVDPKGVSKAGTAKYNILAYPRR